MLAGETPSKDEIIAADEQKVGECLHFINFVLSRILVKF